MKILLIFKIFVLFSLASFGQAMANERFQAQLMFQIYNRDSGDYLDISPSDGYTFEVVSQNNQVHTLRVFNSAGDELGANFITHNSNVRNNFIAAPVREADEVIQLTRSLVEAPCDDCELAAVTIDPVGDETVTLAASSVPVVEECQIPGTTDEWKLKCQSLYEKGIPRGALNFALKTMKLNATSFRTNKCWNSQGIKHRDHPSMMGLTENQIENNLMAEGFQNKCQMVINDFGDKPRGQSCRGTMYYIDLCSGSEARVTKTYANMGTGTCRDGRGYADVSGRHTTVLGAFFTHNSAFDFTHTTTQTGHYSTVRRTVRNLGGPNRASSLMLFGMQDSNNLASSTGKYMHVSTYRSSWGCPSIDPSNYHMIETLAANGPSLVVNYHEGRMEDIDSCTE